MKLSKILDKSIEITQDIVGELEPRGIRLEDKAVYEITFNVIKKINFCLSESGIETEIDITRREIYDKIEDKLDLSETIYF